jgi:hypothetical protein
VCVWGGGTEEAASRQYTIYLHTARGVLNEVGGLSVWLPHVCRLVGLLGAALVLIIGCHALLCSPAQAPHTQAAPPPPPHPPTPISPHPLSPACCAGAGRMEAWLAAMSWMAASTSARLTVSSNRSLAIACRGVVGEEELAGAKGTDVVRASEAWESVTSDVLITPWSHVIGRL